MLDVNWVNKKGFLEEVPETTICKSLRAEGIKASIPGEKGKTEE